MRRGVGRVAAAVVMAAAACSPAHPSAAATVVAGAFGRGVFITSVWSDPWAAVGDSVGPGPAATPDTACFLAADGRRWTRCGLVSIDTDGPHTRLLGVARIGSTLLAGGVAQGALHGNPRPYMFAGPVGGPLTELNLPREEFGGERIIAYDGLAAGPRGGFGVGTWDGLANRSVAQVWRTATGADWRRLDGVASLTATPSEILGGRAVAVGAGRVVVVGAVTDLQRLADRDDGIAWWSDDGSAWSRADLRSARMGGPGDQELRAVAAIGGTAGFLTGGSDGAEATVWSSPDGETWRRAAALPGGAGSGATVTAVVGRVDGSGGEWAAGVVGGAPRLWRSADGHRWVGVELPTSALASVAGTAQSVALAEGSGQLVVVVRGTEGSSEAVLPLG